MSILTALVLAALVLAALVLACCGVTWLNLRGGAR